MAERLAEERLGMSKMEALRWLTSVIKTPIGEVNASSPLCQDYSEVKTETTTALRVRMVDKLGAVRLMAEMCGWLVSVRTAPALVPVAGQALPEKVDLHQAAQDLCAMFKEMDSKAGENSRPEVLEAGHQ